MLSPKLQEFAKRELQRRRAPRHGLSIWWVIFWTPLLWGLSALLVVSLATFPTHFTRLPAARAFGFAFAVGGVLFLLFPLRPLYVFGHEFTHWLTAVLTGHKAGFPRLGLRQGSVEVAQPTLLIALAPYILPLFLLLSAIALTIVRCFQASPFPHFWDFAFAWLGLCYSYHIVLTILALANGQTDLQFRGPVLSYSVIVFGNLLVLYLALVIVSQNWSAAWQTPYFHTQKLIRCINHLL